MGEEVRITFGKCVRCPFVPCVDLFKSFGELEGEELFILRESIRRKELLPCIVGAPLYTLCRITSALATSKQTEYLPVTHILQQIIRDLKCSCFLALVGHYRNAVQVLRPVIENFLAGIYFTLLGDVEAYIRWLNGEYKVPPSFYEQITGKRVKEGMMIDYHFCLEFITKNIPKDNRKWWGKRKSMIESKIIRPINNYLHPHFPSFEIAKGKKCSRCPASLKFDREELGKWLELYQRILFILLEFLLVNFGDIIFSDEGAREALHFLIQPPEAKERFLVYMEYKRFTEWLEERLKEYEQNSNQNR